MEKNSNEIDKQLNTSEEIIIKERLIEKEKKSKQSKNDKSAANSKVETKSASRPKIKNLVFEGGGIKGLAYVGALKVLARKGVLKHVENIAGASAGAITALIIGLGYDRKAIMEMLATDFSQFADGPAQTDKLGQLINVANLFGAHPGNKFKEWIEDIIEKQLGKKEATFEDLHRKVVSQENPADKYRFRDIYFIGSNLSTRYAEIFSYYHTPKMPLADAVRISMSIPVFFQPKFYKKNDKGEFIYDKHGKLIEGTYDQDAMYVDGGLIDNFPVSLFDIDYPNPQTLGLRVDAPDEINVLRDSKLPTRMKPVKTLLGFGNALVNAARSAQAKQHHIDNFRTIYIDIGETKATQFTLNEEEKKTLVAAGKKAAEEYFRITFDNPKAKQVGHRIISNKQRHEKWERAHIYFRASKFHHSALAETSHHQVYLIFEKPAENKDPWELQQKLMKYYQWLQQHAGIYRLEYFKNSQEKYEHMLVLTLEEPLYQEYQKWLVKNGAEDKCFNTLPYKVEDLILVKRSTEHSKPSWMFEKANPDSQKLFKFIDVKPLEAIRQLVATGADVNYKDEDGNSALHKVASLYITPDDDSALKKIKFLLDHEAQINGQNHYGNTPLHEAVKVGNLAVIKTLVERDIHAAETINLKNKYGKTPLHLAVYTDKQEVVDYLLALGADNTLADNEGKTALEEMQQHTSPSFGK